MDGRWMILVINSLLVMNACRLYLVPVVSLKAKTAFDCLYMHIPILPTLIVLGSREYYLDLG
jgi:hypothetical protein